MKRIIAIIRSEKYEDVKKNLESTGCKGMTITEVKGRGSQLGVKESYRGSSYCVDLIPKTRVELVVLDNQVENVIEANLKACLAPHEAAGEAFNIAYGGREYLLDIYHGLTKALGVDIEPNFGPDRAGDIKHSNADISKAKKLLGYDPDWSFNRGIEAAIEWYKENL